MATLNRQRGFQIGAISLVAAGFGVHVYSGGAFEQRTVIAMSMRTLVWVTIAVIAWCGLVRVKPASSKGAMQ